MPPSERRWPIAVLGAILALAATLRVSGLSWGLRHAPESDEALFVGSVVEMIRHHDLEQRFYEYPGLFFHLLRGALTWLSAESLGSPRAYLVARGVVAAFGVSSVALAFRLGTALVSARAGLVAALVLAVSPVEVATAHMVRPDVVLEAFALLTLLCLRLDKPGARSDVVVGTALGAAVAVKLTGAALLPSLILDRWLRPGARVRGLAVSGLAALFLFVAATPDLLLHPAAFARGFRLQWGYHYIGAPGRPISEGSLPFYLRTLWNGLGPAAWFFAVVGIWNARRQPRVWTPILVFPVSLLALLLSSGVHWSRLILPSFGAIAVVAGLGFEAVAQRLPLAAWGVVLAGSLVPASATLSYLKLAVHPGTRDLALDWIEAHVPPRGSVLTSVEGLGVDSSRFEVFEASGSPTGDRRMAETVDAVVLRSARPDLFPSMAPSLTLGSESTLRGPALSLFKIPESLHRRRRQVPVERMRLAASSGEEALPLALDGRLETYWRTSEPDCEGAWVEVTLDREILLAGVDLALGSRPGRAGRHLTLSVPDGRPQAWRAVPTTLYQSGSDEDEPEGSWNEARQVMLFEPALVRALRVRADCPQDHRWGFAEIRLYERLDGPSGSPPPP